jgi:transcriptional regulator with XRE-family HTH domain
LPFLVGVVTTQEKSCACHRRLYRSVRHGRMRASVCVMSTQPEDWSAALHQRIADAVKAARQGRFTAQQLADACEQLGYPISRSMIANIESGRKDSLDVAELLILAAALEVPPVWLLFSNLPDGEVESLPGFREPAAAAMRWFTGEVLADDIDSDAELTDQARLVRLTRQRCAVEDRQARLRDGIDVIGRIGKRKKQLLNEVIELSGTSDEIANLNRQIAAIRGAVAAEREGTQS